MIHDARGLSISADEVGECSISIKRERERERERERCVERFGWIPGRDGSWFGRCWGFSRVRRSGASARLDSLEIVNDKKNREV
jgi:hypothetical protein